VRVLCGRNGDVGMREEMGEGTVTQLRNNWSIRIGERLMVVKEIAASYFQISPI
jgi:hypothetical protein